MALPAPTYVYCEIDDLEAFLSPEGVHARLDDDDAGLELSAEEQSWRTKAIYWATSRANFYLLGRYPAQDLAQSWVVNQWTTVLACHWLSCRRGNPSPGSIKDLYQETVEDLKMVRTGEAQLPEVGLRNSAWPAWSNVRVDHRFRLRKIRREGPISSTESRPMGPFKRFRDIAADYTPEIN